MLKKIIVILLYGMIPVIFGTWFKASKGKKWYAAKDSTRFLGI